MADREANWHPPGVVIHVSRKKIAATDFRYHPQAEVTDSILQMVLIRLKKDEREQEWYEKESLLHQM